jgi:hypothetical protein
MASVSSSSRANAFKSSSEERTRQNSEAIMAPTANAAAAIQIQVGKCLM